MNLEELQQKVEQRQSLSYEEWIQYDLSKNTAEEVRNKYHLSRTDFKKLLKDFDIKIYYENRTPVSKALIPLSDNLNKLMSNPKSQKEYNEFKTSCSQRNWPQREIQSREEIKQEHEAKLGAMLAKVSEMNEMIEKELKSIAYQGFLIDVIKQLGVDNYLGIVAEEQYGNYPIPEFSAEMLTDTMVINYIAAKHGVVTGLKVKELIGGNND